MSYQMITLALTILEQLEESLKNARMHENQACYADHCETLIALQALARALKNIRSYY